MYFFPEIILLWGDFSGRLWNLVGWIPRRVGWGWKTKDQPKSLFIIAGVFPLPCSQILPYMHILLCIHTSPAFRYSPACRYSAPRCSPHTQILLYTEMLPSHADTPLH